jgi:hypothetical protein
MKKIFILSVSTLAIIFFSCKKSNTENSTGGNGGNTSILKTIYSAGYSRNGSNNPIATYWKNDTAFKLTDGTKQGIAKAIVVAGNDVYVAGYDAGVAKYWKKGVATNLSDGSIDVVANGNAVEGADVYVVGSEVYNALGRQVAKYWKNGVATLLTKAGNGETGTVYSICMGN